MAEPSRYLLLVNPSAGGGRARELVPRVEAAMAAAGLEHRSVMTTSLDHACEQATAAAAAGEIPVVMSGDGLIGQIGGLLAGGSAPLGIIPGGRGNDLARVLGISDEVEAAVDVLAARVTREIDVGEVNGKRFLCIASCGFDSDANRIANEARFIKGNLVYAYAGVRALLAWKPARFKLTLDGERSEFTGYSVIVANSRAYGGGMFIAPDAELDDGKFDVVTTAHTGKIHFLTNLPKVFKGEHVDNEEVTIARASEVRVEADRPFAIYADGDHQADLPATFRVLPRSLSVIVPG